MNEKSVTEILAKPWLAEVPDIIRVAASKGIALTPRDIKGRPDLYTIDGMEWSDWFEAMTA